MATSRQAAFLADLIIGYPYPAKERNLDPEQCDAETIEGGIRANVASEHISALSDYAKNTWPWRPLSKQSVAAEILYRSAKARGRPYVGRNDYDAAVHSAKRVGFQGDFKALRFEKNVNGRREPVTVREAEDQFRKQLSIVKAEVNKRLTNQEGENKDRNDELEDELGLNELSEEQLSEIEEEIEKEESEPEDERSKLEIEADSLFEWIWNAGEWCEARDADGHPIDSIGMRPFVDGGKMLAAGIPVEAIKYAMTMHWPDEARRAVGVTEFDPSEFNADDRIVGMHHVTPYVLKLIYQRIPVCLIGKSGVGKTTIAGNLAEHLKLPFGFVSMTRGTSPSAFNGRPRIADDGSSIRFKNLMRLEDDAIDAGNKELAAKYAKERNSLVLTIEDRGDTITSQFVKIYGKGGIYLFDELDAGDENLLLLVNAALANGHFANPATGEIVEKHPDFIPMAGMNTMGLGSTRDHNARNRLDHATLDRWRMGRVIMKLDRDLARDVFNAIISAGM